MIGNLGDVFETVARAIEPEAPAVFCDGEILTWGALDSASNALARRLLAAGLATQSKVGLLMRNGPDYIIALAACLKARLCPFNINYRYGPDEVAYLLDNADCEALVFDTDFAGVVSATRGAADLKLRLSARGETSGAEPLSHVYLGRGDPLQIVRDPDDLLLLYTGGTTGMPKAVMWTQGAIWENQLPGLTLPGKPPPSTPEALAAQIRSGEGRVCFHIPAPLMHGTGQFSALSMLFRGGSVVLTGRPSYEPVMVLQEVQDLKCDGIIIVGDAFARPMLDALRAAPERFNLAHVRAIVSSGMMWSPDVKLGLLEFMPNALLHDGLGASESSGFASAITTRDNAPGEARFDLTGAVVLRPEDLQPVRAGSGEIGILAKAGPLPLGYYKDPERTARTYVMIDGIRHVLGGDHATVETDGTIRLLGRGSHCINTAGEKVYPEEVEEALKTHAHVHDALVFGIPDKRFGQVVAGVVSVTTAVDAGALIAHVRSRLAAYKSPRRIVLVAEVPRAANAKADYKTAKSLYEAAEGASLNV